MSHTLAALDLGTNSFHLVVARFAGEGHEFEVIAREKEMVRLGSGGDDTADMRRLEPDAIDRGIAALTRFRKIADSYDARLYAVATSAVREAENADEFLRRARDEAGVSVHVISGVEEARLIHLGVLQAVPVFDKRILLVDIGGGSTEVLVGERGEILVAASHKLGAIRMTRRFFRSDTIHPAAVDSCRRHVRATLVPMVRSVRQLEFDVAVGSSGTIGAVAAMVFAARDGGDPASLRTWNNFEFTRAEVKGVVQLLLAAPTIEDRRAIPGIEARRADIILGGAIVLDEVMGQFGASSMVVSDYALREGVLLDVRERETGDALHHLHDLRRRGVSRLAEAMDDDPAHAAHTARLALALFDGLEPVHELDGDVRELLEGAALLANVGRFVSHGKHHKHSYYVIRNTDRLTGFTDDEIELMALIARYHRKAVPKEAHPEFKVLGARDRQVVSLCAGVLRVAIALDRSRAGAVAGVRVKVGAGDAPVRVQVLPSVADADLSLERYSVNEHKDLLEDQLGRPVTIEMPDPVEHPGTVSAPGG
jgi:exopolyphosphatase/guanosine-5'-triphosphate,3'-diphosphate pyrophosphatase